VIDVVGDIYGNDADHTHAHETARKRKHSNYCL